jgi:hypothetical protein
MSIILSLRTHDPCMNRIAISFSLKRIRFHYRIDKEYLFLRKTDVASHMQYNHFTLNRKQKENIIWQI